jgi:addiction module HigA family antidote
MAIRLHESFAVHPGPWLRRNMVEPYRLNVSQAAGHLQVSRVTMSNLLNGHADLSPEMAVRFEKAFGISAATLLRMQAAYDLAQVSGAAKALKIERLPEPA